MAGFSRALLISAVAAAGFFELAPRVHANESEPTHADDAELAADPGRSAEERVDPEVAPASEPTGEASGSHWRPEWRRVHFVEGILTGAATAAGFVLLFAGDQTGGWRGLLPGEVAIADAFRVTDPNLQDQFAMISDVAFLALAAAPVLVDALLVAGGIRGDWDAALQMVLIDLESIALSFLVTQLTERLVGRQRPYAYDCERRGDTSARCDLSEGSPNSSFVGGHSLAAFAGAGLVCVHNLENPWIMGSEGGAVAACVTAMSAATGINFMRLMSDRHWLSDVIIGSAIGAALGWILPYVAHYSQEVVRAVPIVAGDAAGLGVAGAF